MQFRVSRAKVAGPECIAQDSTARSRNCPNQPPCRTRQLTLEEFDNLIEEPMTHLLNGTRWHEPITEKPVLNY